VSWAGFSAALSTTTSATLAEIRKFTSADFKRKKGKGRGTCYSVAYMSQIYDQKRFSNLEVAADWQEPMIPRHIMRLSIAHANEQVDPWSSSRTQTYLHPNQPH